MNSILKYSSITFVLLISIFAMVKFVDIPIRIVAIIVIVLSGTFLVYEVVKNYKANEQSQKMELKRGQIVALGFAAFLFSSAIY